MPDVSFPAIDGLGFLKNFSAFDPGSGNLSPYRRTDADQQAEITTGLNAIKTAVEAGGESKGAVATVNAPTYTQGDSVALSVDLVGNLRTITRPAAGASWPVTGTFFQATQPVSFASQPLPTGAATEVTLAAIDTKLGATAPQLPKTPLLLTSDLTYILSVSSTSSSRLLVAGISGQTIRVHRIVASAAGGTTLDFLDGAAGSVLFSLEFPAAGAYVLDISERAYAKTTVANPLHVKPSATVKTSVGIYYIQGV